VNEDEDTPRSTFAVFSWRVNLAVVVCLVAVSIGAWLRTLEDADSMSGMVMGLGQIGARARGTMDVTVFLVMWTIMMTAMMLPTAAPMVLAHLAVVRRRGGGVFPTTVFVAGYLAVWSATGIVPYVAYAGFSQLAAEAAHSRWLPMLAGGILVFAGAYQFTGWKQVCLDRCQSPFAFILTHDFGGGARSALRAGLWHGTFCLGCCWALMLVLIVVGLMNLAWMVGIFLIFFAEKSWRHGLVLAKLAGASLVGLGLAVIAEPAVLATIS
jgi:predicted metal-binding membrane protein